MKIRGEAKDQYDRNRKSHITVTEGRSAASIEAGIAALNTESRIKTVKRWGEPGPETSWLTEGEHQPGMTQRMQAR